MKEKYDNVVIEVSLNPILMDAIKDLKDSPIVQEAKEIHLVHVTNSGDSVNLPESLDRRNRDEVDAYIDDVLEQLKEYLMEGCDESTRWSQCAIHNRDVKLSAVEYLKDVNADLVVTATRGMNECLYSDSFSCYLIGHSPCDVHVLKQ